MGSESDSDLERLSPDASDAESPEPAVSGSGLKERAAAVRAGCGTAGQARRAQAAADSSPAAAAWQKRPGRVDETLYPCPCPPCTLGCPPWPRGFRCCASDPTWRILQLEVLHALRSPWAAGPGSAWSRLGTPSPRRLGSS